MNKKVETNRTEKVNKMNDKKLYKLCKKFGAMALKARRKFAGLLPEVLKRKLYEKRGFSSIYEFAAKLAGMSHEQVDLVIRLERKFSDKPLLREALTEGEISANKLVRVASIVTEENEEEVFETVKLLSNRAVEVFVKDVKRSEENFNDEKEKNLKIFDSNDGEKTAEFQYSNGLLKPEFGQKSLHVHGEKDNKKSSYMTTLKLASDVEKELSEMQEKGIDVNEFLREAIRQRKEDIERRKDEIAAEMGLLGKPEFAEEIKQNRMDCTEVGLSGKAGISAEINEKAGIADKINKKSKIFTNTNSENSRTITKDGKQEIPERASGANKDQSSVQKTGHTNGKNGDYVDENMRMRNTKQINKSMNVENGNYISKNRPPVNAKTKKLLREEHGTKCSIPGCTRPSKIIHHTRHAASVTSEVSLTKQCFVQTKLLKRFSLTYNNDPHFLAPMCEEHHEIAHKIDLKYAEKTNLHT